MILDIKFKHITILLALIFSYNLSIAQLGQHELSCSIRGGQSILDIKEQYYCNVNNPLFSSNLNLEYFLVLKKTIVIGSGLSLYNISSFQYIAPIFYYDKYGLGHKLGRSYKRNILYCGLPIYGGFRIWRINFVGSFQYAYVLFENEIQTDVYRKTEKDHIQGLWNHDWGWNIDFGIQVTQSISLSLNYYHSLMNADVWADPDSEDKWTISHYSFGIRYRILKK